LKNHTPKNQQVRSGNSPQENIDEFFAETQVSSRQEIVKKKKVIE
jgi:hypothetical protein